MTEDNSWFAKDIAGFDLSWAPPGERGFLNELVGIDAASIEPPGADRDGIYWKYRPYPLSTLGSILAPLCAKGVVNSFLEVGCGIGTRLIMVDRMFGIPAVGFDRNPDYIQIANSYVNQFNARRVIVHTQDAFDYQLYNEFDCVFLNKPIWDRTLEIALEDYVYNSVKPGSIFLAGQTITQPPWEIIAEATALAVYKVTSERRHSSILQT